MMRALACGVLFLVLPLSAAQMSGIWTGTLEITGADGKTQSDRCYMVLQQKGPEITGTVGPDKSVQWKIENGRADGPGITFAVFPPEGGRLSFALRLAGNHLSGEAHAENQGLSFKAKVDLTRSAH